MIYFSTIVHLGASLVALGCIIYINKMYASLIKTYSRRIITLEGKLITLEAKLLSLESRMPGTLWINTNTNQAYVRTEQVETVTKTCLKENEELKARIEELEQEAFNERCRVSEHSDTHNDRD